MVLGLGCHIWGEGGAGEGGALFFQAACLSPLEERVY